MKSVIIDNRYALRGLLGSGGTARVYRAHDRMLDRDVALKVLGDHHADDEELVERFRQEAQSTAPLSHDNIVAVYDRGRSAEGYYYIAMECVSGGTLKSRIRESGHLGHGTVVEIGRQVAEALRAAHAHGIVHRDVKPHNILLTDTGTVKVADFGIAQSSPGGEVAQESFVYGTVRYMSPEQAMGEAVGPQSDLYSLGVVLYEALTGRVPFDAESPVAVAMKHVNESLRPPREVDSKVPRAMSALVTRLLEKDPADRYPNADGLLEDLEQLRRAPSAAERSPLSGGAARSLSPQANQVTGGGAERRWRRYARRASAVAIVVAVASVGSASWSSLQSGSEPATASVEALDTRIPALQLPEPEESAAGEAETDQAGAEEPAAEEPDEPAAEEPDEPADPEASEQEPEQVEGNPPVAQEPEGPAVPEEPSATETAPPAAQASRDSEPEPVADPAPEPVAEPVSDPSPEPAAEPVSDPSPEPVADPAADSGGLAGVGQSDPAPSGGVPAPESAPEAERPGAAEGVLEEPGAVPAAEAPDPVEPEQTPREPGAVEQAPSPEPEAGAPEAAREDPGPSGREVAPNAGALLSSENRPQLEPEVAQPEVAQPEVAQPEVAQPEVAQPEVAQPEVAQPEVAQPEVAQPEVAQPEVAQPEIAQPEAPRGSGPDGDLLSPGPDSSPGPSEIEVGPDGSSGEDTPGPGS